jgi:polar amino acid transport system substrate-binding protein
MTEIAFMNFRRTLLLAAASVLLPLAPVSSFAQEALRVVTDATFPPMEFVKDGKRTGFDIELVEALGVAMGRKIEWIDIDFKGLIPALVSKRADLAMSAIYITDERKKVVDFSDSYFAGGLVVLTNKAGPIKTLKDLDGKKVSVQVGTKSVGFLKDNYPKVERIEVEKNQEMFNLVEIGRADAAVTGKPAAKIFAQAKPQLYVLAEQLTTEDYGIAVRKDTPEIRDAVNVALKKIRADGTYDKLVQKWFEAGK